jgi:hypothetical protein
MQTFPKMNTGFIVLEHDLYPQTVDAAVQIIDRAVKVPNLQIMTVPQCIGDNSPYLELVGKNNSSSTTKSSESGKPPSISTSSSANIIPFTVGSIITVLFSSLLNFN